MSTATAAEGDVSMGVLFACVVAGILVAVGTFALTWDILLALVGYVATACFSYALTWVMV